MSRTVRDLSVVRFDTRKMTAIVTIPTIRAFERLGGLAYWQRSTRALHHLGVSQVRVISCVSPLPDAEELARGGIVSEAGRWTQLESPMISASELGSIVGEPDRPVVIVPGDMVFDTRILAACTDLLDTTACIDSDPPEWLAGLLEDAPDFGGGRLCGVMVATRDWLDSNPGELGEVVGGAVRSGLIGTLDVATLAARASNLRRELRPFWFPAPSAENRDAARGVLMSSTQKGALDIPAIVHAPIEKLLAWKLADTPITPNVVTVLTTILAWTGTLLFATGRLGWGLAAALIVGVLDGVDGKLARLRYEFSRFGELEHWLDFFYEWSWWAALAYYFSSSGRMADAWWYFGLLALFEILDGVAKLVNIRWFGCLIDEMSPFERAVRLLGGRRNIYVWLLTFGALVGSPETTFRLLPLWQGATALLHWIRLPWLVATRSRDSPLEGAGR